MAPYVAKPDWFTVKVFNPMVAGLAKMGIGAKGVRILGVRGRKTGQLRTTPVQLLTVEGTHYLVAPRGHVQWTHNLRSAGEGHLQSGKKTQAFTAVEVCDTEKPEVLRAYLKTYNQAKLFRVAGPEVPNEDLARISPHHPAFRVTLAA